MTFVIISSIVRQGTLSRDSYPQPNLSFINNSSKGKIKRKKRNNKIKKEA